MIRAETGNNRNDFLGATVLQCADCVVVDDAPPTSAAAAASAADQSDAGAHGAADDDKERRNTRDVRVSLDDEESGNGDDVDSERIRLRKVEAATQALMTGVGVEFWTPLIGVKSGRIKLRMRLEPFEDDETGIAAAYSSSAAGGGGDGIPSGPGSGNGGSSTGPESLNQRGTLIVSLRRGNNLYNRHAGRAVHLVHRLILLSIIRSVRSFGPFITRGI